MDLAIFDDSAPSEEVDSTTPVPFNTRRADERGEVVRERQSFGWSEWAQLERRIPHAADRDHGNSRKSICAVLMFGGLLVVMGLSRPLVAFFVFMFTISAALSYHQRNSVTIRIVIGFLVICGIVCQGLQQQGIGVSVVIAEVSALILVAIFIHTVVLGHSCAIILAYTVEFGERHLNRYSALEEDPLPYPMVPKWIYVLSATVSLSSNLLTLIGSTQLAAGNKEALLGSTSAGWTMIGLGVCANWYDILGAQIFLWRRVKQIGWWIYGRYREFMRMVTTYANTSDTWMERIGRFLWGFVRYVGGRMYRHGSEGAEWVTRRVIMFFAGYIGEVGELLRRGRRTEATRAVLGAELIEMGDGHRVQEATHEGPLFEIGEDQSSDQRENIDVSA